MEQHPSSQSSIPSPHSSHASFPIIAVAIIGIFATIFLLVFYYIFVIKCCLNWHRIDILRRFSLSRNTSTHHHPLVSTTPEPKGLHESVIRSIPVFHYQKQADSDTECAVCLAEFQHFEKLRMIPNCGHVFHIDCIDVWLQNNPNCPLCRNSISISIPSHHFPLPDNHPPQVVRNEEDYVVIELSNGGGGGGGQETGVSERRNIHGDVEKRNLGESRKRKKLVKKYGHVSSMGDECIDVNASRRKGDEQFLVQPIRRSFSMDSALDRQLLLAVQEIVQRNSMDNVDVTKVNDGCSSTSNNIRLGRSFFSFGHARSAILPLHLTP